MSKQKITLPAEHIVRRVMDPQVEKKHYSQIKWLERKKFIGVRDGAEYLVFDVETDLLWYVPNGNEKWKTHFQFETPKQEQLSDFANKHREANPMALGGNGRLFNMNYWLTQEGMVDLDTDWGSSYSVGGIILVSADFKSPLDFVKWASRQGLTLSYDKQHLYIDVSNSITMQEAMKSVDWQRCRLPLLDDNRFTDLHQGLWELHGVADEYLLQEGVRARNPVADVKQGCIGIDFGTSSTVVAYEDDNGRARLLRVGVNDFYAPAEPAHYENPTILEFIDFERFAKAWGNIAQQPLVDWDTVRCSHEALLHLRQSDDVAEVVSAMLPKIKQWALREAGDVRVRISDQVHDGEYELAPLTLRNPVKGQALQVSHDDPFDPIELYAWFLGLNINWRARGIFLTYYMTFPVAYPKEVKEKILASFRRGLLRSLPQTLTENSALMERFSVEERASEPAAYAAAAMPAHGIDPTEEGVAYAVFDFGGGTTDFDFGIYRWASEEEEANEGVEKVIEHFEAAGDKFLGGENLLENMAYKVFCDNLDVCRSGKFSFTRPLDADDFSGSELLVAKTQAAYANTLMLMSKLRPFWETGKRERSGIAKLNVIGQNGEKAAVELSVNYDLLQEYLDTRIQQGIYDFFVAMKKAFADKMPKTVHILLAGNASRSRMVTDAFGLLPEGNTDDVAQARCDVVCAQIERIFGERNPELIAHLPLAAKRDDESVPTAKTGVALGILKLQKGSGIKVINNMQELADGEAPFAYYVGGVRRGKFVVGLPRNASYGEWKALGMPSEGVFRLHYTTSNLAHGDQMEAGDKELYVKRLSFVGIHTGKKVFARAVAPNSIEVCLAENEEALAAGDFDNLSVEVLVV